MGKKASSSLSISTPMRWGGGRWRRRVLCACGIGWPGKKRKRQQDGGACRRSPASQPEASTQHQQSENVGGEKRDGRKIEPRLDGHRLFEGVAAYRTPFDRAQWREHRPCGDEVEGAGGAGRTVIAGRMIRPGHGQ